MGDAVLAFAVLAVVVVVFGTAAWASLRAAPWLPTRTRDLGRMMRLARLKPGESLVDLGCGDGRALFAAARDFQANATGYEISLIPYLVAKLRWVFSPVRRRVTIVWRDFFSVPLTEADVVFCFLTPEAMKKLRTKFVQELKPGARVVSYAFALKGFPDEQRDKPTPTAMPIFLSRVPLQPRALTTDLPVVE